MKLLLDTHVLLWSVDDPERIGAEAREVLAEAGNPAFVSVATLWEIAIKIRIGKLNADLEVILSWLSPASKLQLLGVTPDHLRALKRLPRVAGHRDPFDQLLVAQAVAEGMILLTRDGRLDGYPVSLMRA